jgi:hypothetical protein
MTTIKRVIRPLDLEILRKERQQGTERTTTPKECKRKNNLALSVDVRSLGQRNASGDLLSTNLGLSLASTSWVIRVDLYGLNKMAQTLAHPKKMPWLTAFYPSVMETDENQKDYEREKFRSLPIRTPL